MRIRLKILAAFGALFAAVFGTLGAVAVRLVSEAVEHQFAAQAANAGALFSSWNVPLDPKFVADNIRKVYGAEVAVLDDLGRWGSTLDAASRTAIEAARRAGGPGPLAVPGRVTPWRLADGRETFAIYVPYTTRRPTNVLEDGAPVTTAGAIYLFYPAAQVEAEKARARRPVLFVGAAGLLLVAAAALWLARSITRPLEELTARARGLATGHLEGDSPPGSRQTAGGNRQTAGDSAAESGSAKERLTADGPLPTADYAGPAGDEVAHLSLAFDRMIEGLRRSQADLLRHEQLAVTGRIAAGIAHEIRNPLTAMRMTVQLLAREERDAGRRESLDLLLREVGRLEAAVSELMDLASPAPARRVPVDLNRLADEVLTLVQPQLAHHGIEPVREMAPLPPVAGDPDRLRRVVLNLVLNGIQAMPAKGRLTVRTAVHDATSSVSSLPFPVCIEVTDTGPGIPADLQDRVFEPFVTTKEGGTGLGLATVRRIVEEHGGRVTFATGAAGTTFRVELPPSRQ